MLEQIQYKKVIRILVIILWFYCSHVFSQEHHLQHLYKPQKQRIDSAIEQTVNDTLPATEKETVTTSVTDSVNADSLRIVWQLKQESIAARLKFIEDSIKIREAFVRDSIARRVQILDSLKMLKKQLEPLLEASLKTFSNEIIFKDGGIYFVGDTMLSNYECDIITFDFTSAYTPWKLIINLSDKPPQISYNKKGDKIIGIKTPQFTCNYSYAKNGKVLIINSKSVLLNRSSGRVYKQPVDSVFFNGSGKVVKIKRYQVLYSVVNNYKRGALLYSQILQVKQYQYNSGGVMVSYELTKFCDRRLQSDPVRVCNIVRYDISKKYNAFYIARSNTPENVYSDGTFTYKYNGDILSEVSFTNNTNSEKRKTIIEVNEKGNVSRYLYQLNGKINQTLLVHYLSKPNGQEYVETITCVFEDDGISYYQKNNMSGKSRTRDKLTLEWSDWK